MDAKAQNANACIQIVVTWDLRKGLQWTYSVLLCMERFDRYNDKSREEEPADAMKMSICKSAWIIIFNFGCNAMAKIRAVYNGQSAMIHVNWGKHRFCEDKQAVYADIKEQLENIQRTLLLSLAT